MANRYDDNKHEGLFYFPDSIIKISCFLPAVSVRAYDLKCKLAFQQLTPHSEDKKHMNNMNKSKAIKQFIQ